jgi:predicted amidohydrolase
MLRTERFILASFTVFAGVPALADEAAPALDGWKTQVVRDEMAPRFWVQHPKQKEGSAEYELGMAGQGSEVLDGRWVRRQPVVAGKHYVFHAEFHSKQVATPARSILARVFWFDPKGKRIGEAEFPCPNPLAERDAWTTLSTIYQAPETATQAQLELHLRWTPNGTVLWRKATLTETKPAGARKVRLAAVNHRPQGTSSSEENLGQFATLISEAALQKADIVCLPEGITQVGTKYQYADMAEPIPGQSTRFLGQQAKKHHLYIVAGLYERAGKAIYNTSVLIGRDGELVGKYRKVCLPREEIDGGMTPGSEYPVFDTDFGRVAMMICWDVSYPEVARELAAKGAEVILMPIAGGNEILVRARAIENQVHLVTSGYDIPTAIYNRAGEALAKAKKDPEVVVCEVDLNARQIWYWLGDWRSRIWREGPPRLQDKH